MATSGMVVGGVSGGELVVGGLSGGGVWRPTVLRSIRHRSCTGMEIILNMQARDLRVILEDRRKEKYRDNGKQAIRRTIVSLGLICGPGPEIVCG